jgi:hypothetical protein
MLGKTLQVVYGCLNTIFFRLILHNIERPMQSSASNISHCLKNCTFFRDDMLSLANTVRNSFLLKLSGCLLWL